MNTKHSRYLLLFALVLLSAFTKAQQTLPTYDTNGNQNGTLIIDNFHPLTNYDKDEYNGVNSGIQLDNDKSIKAIPSPAPAFPWGNWTGWAGVRENDKLAIFLPNNHINEYNPHHPMDAYLSSPSPGQVDCADPAENALIYSSQTTDQTELFKFSFTVHNTSLTPQYFHYKIYYQNESYKFPNTDDRNYKNFYGSFGHDENRYQSIGPTGNIAEKGLGQGHWGVVEQLIPANTKITVRDEFRIRGNPRNELEFYRGPILTGGSNDPFMSNLQRLESIRTKTSPSQLVYDNTNDTWPNSAETLVHLLVDDAHDLKFEVYKNATTNEMRDCGDYNLGREYRNPQVGEYSFMLMASTVVSEVPDHIIDISKKTITCSIPGFENPFAYFDPAGAGAVLPNTKILEAENTLKMYIEPLLSSVQKFDNGDLTTNIITNRGDVLHTDGANGEANISPCSEFMAYPYKDKFTGYGVWDDKIHDYVPVLADIVGDNWTQMDYTWHRNFVDRSTDPDFKETIRAINDYRHVDGATPVPSGGNGELHLTIPGHTWDDLTDEDEMVKYTSPTGSVENLPVRESPTVTLRYPLTYGKYRAKIEFPEILSDNDVFNGITCAFWFFGGGGRRCDNDVHEFDIELYPAAPPNTNDPTGWFTYGPPRIPNSNHPQLPDQYDHLDWSPNVSYANQDIRVDISMFDYRNFESNCNCVHQVPNPIDPVGGIPAGVIPPMTVQTSNGQNFDSWRNPNPAEPGRIAIKQASRMNHDDMFGKDFWYEIEWTPTEVFYRIGPTENNMQLVGYMDGTQVKLPEAAEDLIINIEFLGNADTYATDDIPFNSEPITAKIKKVIIE